MYSSSRPRLSINLRQLQENYLALRKRAEPAAVSAVIKANAYGIGMQYVAPALLETGCSTFWVARLHEGEALRAVMPNATIYVLDGPAENDCDTFMRQRLRPVIATSAQLKTWLDFKNARHAEPVALHVETGLNRLALKTDSVTLANQAWQDKRLSVALIMSHLACADVPDHPMNNAQLAKFEEVKHLFPGLPASLSASYGLYLRDPAFYQNIVRVGRALYGIKNAPTTGSITHPALRLSAPVVQVTETTKGMSVGYNATWQAKAPHRIATLEIGYADGIPRLWQNKGCVYFSDGSKTYAAPIAGRISMDLLSCDVTNVPPEIAREGAWGDLFNAEHYIDEFASRVGTIDYEILTRLASRIERVTEK